MRPITLIDTLVALYRLGRTVCIEGPPGGGKTTIGKRVADIVGVPLIMQHTATMLVEDFGIPYLDADGVVVNYKMPHWYPYKGKPGTENGGILLFDDRNQASADVQKVLANICEEKTLHGVPMADGWQVVSTGNRKQDRAGSNRVLTHLRGRETVIELETHLDDWSKWALDHGVDPVVVAFLRYRPNLLHDFDPQQDQNPTPRSWVEGVSALLGHIPAEAEYECFKGAVGEGAAAEFLGFLKVYRKLPNPDAILLNPDKAKVPDDPITLYALAGALASRASTTNFDNLCRYLDRLPPEFSVLTVTMAVTRDADLTTTNAFTTWATKHHEVLF